MLLFGQRRTPKGASGAIDAIVVPLCAFHASPLHITCSPQWSMQVQVQCPSVFWMGLEFLNSKRKMQFHFCLWNFETTNFQMWENDIIFPFSLVSMWPKKEMKSLTLRPLHILSHVCFCVHKKSHGQFVSAVSVQCLVHSGWGFASFCNEWIAFKCLQ